VDQLGGVLSEGFSSPEITLLRAPPGLPPEPTRQGSDELARINDTSLVTMFEVIGRRLLFPGDAHGDDILYGLRAAGYLIEGERLHLDCMVLPNFGSASRVSDRFLSTVTADHYVVQGTRRFMLPRPDLVCRLARARGSEPFTLHVGLGVDDDTVRKAPKGDRRREGNLEGRGAVPTSARRAIVRGLVDESGRRTIGQEDDAEARSGGTSARLKLRTWPRNRPERVKLNVCTLRLAQPRDRFALDSALEGDGFERSVPDRSPQRNTNRLPRRKIRTGSKPWPISHETGRSHALPSRRLPMEKVTRLDGRFGYLRAVSMGGVMQRGLGRHCHCTD